MKEFLNEFIMNHLFIKIDGVNINLVYNSNIDLYENSFQKSTNRKLRSNKFYHNNNIMSLILEGIIYESTVKYFETVSTIAIQTIVI